MRVLRDFNRIFSRRKRNHDYRNRGTYLVTMLKSLRAPWFCSITNDPEASKISPIVTNSPSGQVIADCITHLPVDYPVLEVLDSVIMPDHLHIVLSVTERSELALGSMLAAFKNACNNNFRTTFPDSALGKARIPLFEQGFNDKIAYRHDSKDAFCSYIVDNPRRYLVKGLCSDYFFHKLQIEMNGIRCGLYGNPFLLDHPFKSCVDAGSDLHNDSRLGYKLREWTETIRCGGVLVSPFARPYEHHFLNDAIKNGTGIILITDRLYSDPLHPYRELFDRCLDGRLLIVSTEQYPASTAQTDYSCAQILYGIADTITSLAPRAAILRRRPNPKF